MATGYYNSTSTAIQFTQHDLYAAMAKHGFMAGAVAVPVQELNLSSNSINGSLPTALPPQLKVLDLSFNNISGPLPTAWATNTSSNLELLYLSGNPVGVSAALCPACLQQQKGHSCMSAPRPYSQPRVPAHLRGHASQRGCPLMCRVLNPTPLPSLPPCVPACCRASSQTVGATSQAPRKACFCSGLPPSGHPAFRDGRRCLPATAATPQPAQGPQGCGAS